MGIMDEYKNFGELADVALESLFFESNKILSNKTKASYYSVDDVKKYKPFKDIYLSVAKQEGIKTDNIVMVATHDWDLFGAKKAGLRTAYIKRKETIYHPYYLQPDFGDSNLPNLIQQLIDHQ